MEDPAAVVAVATAVDLAEVEAPGRQTAARPRANVDVAGDEPVVPDDAANDAVVLAQTLP